MPSGASGRIGSRRWRGGARRPRGGRGEDSDEEVPLSEQRARAARNPGLSQIVQHTPSRPIRYARVLAAFTLLQLCVGLFYWLRPAPASAGKTLVQPPPPPQPAEAPRPTAGRTAESGANITAFADPDAPLRGTQRALSDLAVLLLASGRRPEALRESLKSLGRVGGFSAPSVLVVQAAPGAASRQVAQDEFGLSWVGPPDAPADASAGAAGAAAAKPPPAGFEAAAAGVAHYRRSLEHAAQRHFADQQWRSLVVLEEGLVFSADLLWYFAQLEPLLFSDTSLWCISAWNDNGLAPFVADLTVVMRSDWFSGVGWLARLDGLRELPPVADALPWRRWLRSGSSRAEKQCLFPEVPRLAFTIAECDGACTDLQDVAKQLAAGTAISTAAAANLGDVGRLEADRYRELFVSKWPNEQGLAHAVPVRTITDLEGLMDYGALAATKRDELGKGNRLRPILLSVAGGRPPSVGAVAAGSGGTLQPGAGLWDPVAAFLGLPGGELREAYQGVARLRWRDSTLFVAADSSPLLHALNMRPRPLEVTEFSARLSDWRRAVPAAIPPRSLVQQGSLGASCTQYCQAEGRTCVDADLAAVGRCAAPLTLAFACRRCSTGGDSAAFPGWDRDASQCVSGNSHLSSGNSGPAAVPGDCSASAPHVRRLCVCRHETPEARAHLQSPVRSAGPDQVATGSAPQRFPKGFPAVGKTSRSRPALVNISRFAPQPFVAGRPPKTEVQPSEIPVLVVAVASRRSLQGPRSHWELGELKATLTSLARAIGLKREQVVVAHDDGLLATVQLIEEEFSFLRLEVRGAEAIPDWSRRNAALYKAAISQALVHFSSARSLIVLEEGVRVAPDILWYFAQLEPVVRNDNTLFCASAWNDNGLAPYVADPTVVMRTDWFPGNAWLMPTWTLKSEMLSKWPSEDWERLFRSIRVRLGRQCLVPEVPRANRAPAPVQSGLKRPGRGRAGGREPSHEAVWQHMPLCNLTWVDLGDVGRLHRDRYRRLFLWDWPGEGLINAKPLPLIKPLLDGKITKGGPWRLVFRNEDPETDKTWEGMAAFFGLPAQAPMRGAYLGVVRLRWQGSVLFLVSSSSSLTRPRPQIEGNREDDVAGQIIPPTRTGIVDPVLFESVARPPLLPANGELIGAVAQDTSCTVECRERELGCVSEDLFFINTCSLLESVFSCRSCEPNEGAEQPAQAVDPLSAVHQKCLYNTNLRLYPPSCDAKHANTRRLCVCRSNSPALAPTPASPVAAVGSAAPQASSAQEAMVVPSVEAAKVVPAAPSAVPVGTGVAQAEGVANTRSPVAVVDEMANVAVPDAPLLASLAAAETKASDIPILVVAVAHHTRELRECLKSLSKLNGFNSQRVLVSQDGDNEGAQRIAEVEFRVGWVRFKPNVQRFSSVGERSAMHYKFAISHALEKYFIGAKSLAVLEGDIVVAPDLLWYFAQLEPLLRRDESLLCISAWNDNGLAPYVADPTTLMRTDSFVGVAWLLSAALFKREYLPAWPKNNWDKYLRGDAGRKRRQCIVPETPRAHHIGRMSEDIRANIRAAADRDAAMYFNPSLALRVVDLGNVSRMLAKEYRKSFIEALTAAQPLASLADLPLLRPSEDDTAASGQGASAVAANSWRLHYVSERPEQDASWRQISKFFQLPQMDAPRGAYGGVTRLRWGSGVLFLVASGAALVAEARLSPPPGEPLDPLQFQEAKRPVLLPPDGIVLAAEEPGMSCTAVCGKRGRICISADLPFINSCQALRRFHFCERCEANEGPDQPALAARKGSRYFGSCLYNQEPIKYPHSCEAFHGDTRRLCVCRPPASASSPAKAAAAVVAQPSDSALAAQASAGPVVPLGGQGAERQEADPAGGVAPDAAVDGSTARGSVASDASSSGGASPQEDAPAQVEDASPATEPAAALGSASAAAPVVAVGVGAEAVSGWEPGVRSPPFVQGAHDAFADPDSWPKSYADLYPGNLAVVVMATSVRLEALRRCLVALVAADGIVSEAVLVVQDISDVPDGGKAARQVVEEFGLARLEHLAPALSAGAREAAHYRFALERALQERFKTADALLVIDEGTALAPDALWYFAQLQPLLLEDTSLLCVTGWNDNGLAPYVADPTVLLRTDWFSGLGGWMLRAEALRQLLPKWPSEGWRPWLRQEGVRQGKHCVFPEVSRSRLLPPASVAASEARGAYEEHVSPIFWQKDRRRVNLGNVFRMRQASYERLLLSGWPSQESLAKAADVPTLDELDKLPGGVYRILLDAGAAGWRAWANFLQLAVPEGLAKEADGRALPGFYRGVLRLRWRGAVLYLVFRDSPLLADAGQLPADSLQVGPDRRPIELRAANTAVVVSRRGQSCDDACAESGPGGASIRAWFCHDEDLLFLNSCKILSRLGGGSGACSECLASDGLDQPSVVTVSGKAPALRTCLWNANLAEAPRCSAAHPWTSRACACRPGAGKLALPKARIAEVPAIPANLSIREVFQPRTLVRVGLDRHRCGSAFGNSLGADCAAEGLWCCSGSMRCGNSREDCGGAECPQGPSPDRFCGRGWSLRLPSLGLRPFLSE